MENYFEYEPEYYGIKLGDIFKKAYEKLKEIKKDKEEELCKHDFFGTVLYKLTENRLMISIPKIKQNYELFKSPILFLDEKEKVIFQVYTEISLKEILNLFKKKYDFYVNSQVKTVEDILKNIPPKISLKKKEENNIKFETFKLLNKKYDMPKDKNMILMKTNELTANNIFSLGIRRNENFSMIIDKRRALIDEIQDFMNSDEKVILKIFGGDGVGKSVSFIYLTSLPNNFKTVYFNLKEYHNADDSQKMEIFKCQLIKFFTVEVKSFESPDYENIKDEIYKRNFDKFNETIKNLEKKINPDKIEFWDLLEIWINNINNYNKVLIIFDQYKKENDELNRLSMIEKRLINNISNIKIIVSSSLNDMRVKIDFIDILKLHLDKNQSREIKIFNEKNEDLIEKEVKELFKDYIQTQNYLEKEEDDEESFNDIKIFKDIDDEKQIKINKKESKLESLNENDNIQKIEIIQDEKEKGFNDDNINKNKKCKLLYINDLISVQNIENENIDLINKLEDFNYNPKYYNKFRNYFNINSKNNSLNDLYVSFLNNTYEQIKSKIKKFYKNYCQKNKINFFSNVIVEKLINLEKYIQRGAIFNLSSLIYSLDQIPLKYIKIYQLDEKGQKINNNFFYLNKDISTSNFKIEYSFPFIRFIITRLIFEYGNSDNISYNDLSSSETGSILEKQIRKAIVYDQIFETFYLRNVWAFKKSLTSNKNKIDQKNNKNKEKIESEENNNSKVDNNDKEKEKNIFKIDFFNFNEVKYDDKIKNPLREFNMNYYIIPNNPNNELLDSAILIPICLHNNMEKKFNLVSLQITINKDEIYTIEEYHNATKIAAKLFEEIYDIKIINQYFIFVLAKDYENLTTQKNLLVAKIPFIFFSNIDNGFYLDMDQKLINVEQFLDNKFIILEDKDLNKTESIHNKIRQFKKMSILLERKRKRDKSPTTKNLYSFTRKKMFKNEIALILSKTKKEKIIKTINNEKYYKNKKITIEYAFRARFSKIEELLQYQKLLGIVFFKSHIFLINNKLNSKIIMISDNDNKQSDKLRLLFHDFVNDIYKDKKENLIDNSLWSIEKPNLDNLLKYNLNEPSDIFLFSIYELNK